MSEGGWVKLYRCLMGKAIWKCSSNDRRVILITILMLANHEPNQWMWKGEKFEVKAGQFITSYSKLAETCNVTRECCRCALSNFEKMEFITRETTQSGLLITVVNWAFYQGSEESTTHHTTHEQHTNNTPTTHEQHTNNTPTTPNKNEKKDKNDKNEKKEEKEEPLKEPDGSFSRSDSKIASGTQEEPEAAVEAIPLTNGSEWRPTVSEYDEYARLYPGVDITAAFRAMRGWSLANPTKRKTAAGVRRFVNTWLAKEQDRGSREPPKRRQTADDTIAMIRGA